jgi:hypothetical protein
MDAPSTRRHVRALGAALVPLALAACLDSLEAQDAAPVAPTPVQATPGPAPAGNAPPGSPLMTPEPSERLVVESMEMIEYQYPSHPAHYFYAPLIRVSARNEPVTVWGMSVALPNSNPIPASCTVIEVGADALDLVREVYGDYELAVSRGEGQRVHGGEFTVRIYFFDAHRRAGVVEAVAPATPGGLPPTYSGDMGRWNEECPTDVAL